VTDRLLTAREVAERLGLSIETVLRWAATEKLPSFELSTRAIRFRESEIDAWIEAQKRGATDREVLPTRPGRA
jgi:excisionase family DNA binding protein